MEYIDTPDDRKAPWDADTQAPESYEQELLDAPSVTAPYEAVDNPEQPSDYMAYEGITPGMPLRGELPATSYTVRDITSAAEAAATRGVLRQDGTYNSVLVPPHEVGDIEVIHVDWLKSGRGNPGASGMVSVTSRQNGQLETRHFAVQRTSDGTTFQEQDSTGEPTLFPVSDREAEELAHKLKTYVLKNQD